MSDKTRLLRQLIQRDQGVLALGVASAIDARVAERVGIEALYIGGYAASVMRGEPDMGILTRDEMFRHIDPITSATYLPCMADADEGYGGIHNVHKTVRDLLQKTDVAGIHLEDQLMPKRCGHIAGKEVIPAEEFVGKLRMAIDVRNEVDLSRIIMARTDAFSAAGGRRAEEFGGDMAEAIYRGRLYAEAGADLVWCELPNPSRKTAVAFAIGMADAMPCLGLGFNWSPSFNWIDDSDPVEEQELIGLGYKFRFLTYPTVVAHALATFQFAELLKKIGASALRVLQLNAKGTPAESIMQLSGVDAYQGVEERYSEQARRRLTSSEGFGSPKE